MPMLTATSNWLRRSPMSASWRILIPVAATMPNIAIAAPPSTAGGIDATKNAALGSRLRTISSPPATMVTERQRTPVICTRPIFWAKEEWVKVLKNPAKNEAPASHNKPRRSIRGQTSWPVILPSARNIPVDSTKMITTTRHIDRIGASSNFGMPKCSGVTNCSHGA
ncbi:hypothetical protein D3C86_1511580 [compost metagenome]